MPQTSTHYFPTLSKEFSNYKWKQICGAQHHTIALTDDGKVYAIGRKEYGRLGLGNDCEDASELKLVETLKDKVCTYIACGTSTSFAVTDKGNFFCHACNCLLIKWLDFRRTVRVGNGNIGSAWNRRRG